MDVTKCVLRTLRPTGVTSVTQDFYINKQIDFPLWNSIFNSYERLTTKRQQISK